LKSRGIAPKPAPPSGLRTSGIGDLKSPRVDGSHVPSKAIPANAEGVIVGMEQAAQDGTTAGAQGEGVRHPPGSQRRNLPTAVQGLIAPSNYKVP
jgi:hypothetical protein